MGRKHTVAFKAVGVTAQQDFFEILSPTDAVTVIHGWEFSQVTEFGDAMEEMLQIVTNRGIGAVTSGSGGSTAPYIRWGTLTLGGNLVQVADYEVLNLVINGRPKAPYKMARLVGFCPEDWERPLADLIAEGLVHYCYCAYKNNQFGHSPKGVIYSPFFSPGNNSLTGKPFYDFSGSQQPDALYVPEVWLEVEDA